MTTTFLELHGVEHRRQLQASTTIHASDSSGPSRATNSLTSSHLRLFLTPALTCFNRIATDSRQVDLGATLDAPLNPDHHIFNSCVGVTSVHGFDSMEPYKNNLCVTVSHRDHRYMVVACFLQLILYEISPLTRLPQREPVYRFDTAPPATSSQERQGANWPEFPHTINYITTCDNFDTGNSTCDNCDKGDSTCDNFDKSHSTCDNLNEDNSICANFDKDSSTCDNFEKDCSVIGICFDSGKVLIYRVATLTKAIATQPRTVEPEYTLELSASVWGLLFASQLNLVAASDNSGRVTLLHYRASSKEFTRIVSHRLPLNIPDVCITDVVPVLRNQYRVRLCCALIMGFLCVFEVTFDQESGTFLKIEQVDTTAFGQHCWTARPMDARELHQCLSLAAVFGDLAIDNDTHTRRILHELSMLGQAANHTVSSYLGGACRWQFYECASKDPRPGQALATIGKADWAERVRDYHKRSDKNSRNTLIVTGSLSAALFDRDTLHCYCKMPNVFDFDFPERLTMTFSERISIAVVIPRLLSVLVASQRGKVLQFRVCTYRGIVGMRQEHVLSEPINEDDDVVDDRTIIGLCACDVSFEMMYARYIVHVVYSNGTIVSHELSDPSMALLVVNNPMDGP